MYRFFISIREHLFQSKFIGQFPIDFQKNLDHIGVTKTMFYLYSLVVK